MKRYCFLLGIVLLAIPPQVASAVEVIASIKPLHSLSAAVMGTTGQPKLLIQGHVSEHTYALRPSDARLLAHAEIIFWGGPELEGYLTRPLENLAPKANKMALLAIDGLHRLPLRQGGVWEGDDHDHDAADHKERDYDTAGHKGHATRDHHPNAGSGNVPSPNAHAPLDPHAWLDPGNAMRMTLQIAETLAHVDPTRASAYRDNARQFNQRLEALDRQLAQELANVRQRPYIVFHDAYHYFEKHYGLNSVGSILLHPEQPPGAKRVSQIAARIQSTGAQCLFTEPQFPPRLAQAVASGQPIRIGTLDPIGAAIPEGPELYFELLRGLSQAVRGCLQG
ncbi:MAG: zinc ABC transporter substrate-binding protein [Magnetococcus sp. YQC-9]